MDIAGWIIKILIAGVAITMVMLNKDCVDELKGFKVKPLRQIGWGLLIFAVSLGVLYVMQLINDTPFEVFRFLEAPPARIANFLLSTLLGAVGSELLYRCWLLYFIRRATNSDIKAAVIVTAINTVVTAAPLSIWRLVLMAALALIATFPKVKFKSCTIYSVILAQFLYNAAVASA